MPTQRVLFIGGPAHGRVVAMPERQTWYEVVVREPDEWMLRSPLVAPDAPVSFARVTYRHERVVIPTKLDERTIRFRAWDVWIDTRLTLPDAVEWLGPMFDEPPVSVYDRPKLNRPGE